MAEYTIDKIEYDGNTYNLSPNVVYATCSTAASTAAKVATITSGTLASLNTGDQVIVKFTYANGKASPTLKVGSTDAKSIMRYGTTAPSTSAATSWNAGSCVWFVYDGTYWQMAGWINTTYSEISEANITSGTGSTTGLVSGRRAKAAVGAFESITDVTVGGTTVVSGRVAAIPAIPTVPSNIVNTITTTAGTHTAITNQTGSVSFNVPTKTSHLTNDSGFITNAGVTSITTTAGAHTAITSATGAVSFKVPTTAAHVGAAASDHTHGNITNGGDITATAPTIASGDQIIINDHSASKITNGPTFDGSTTTTALTPKGTWESFAKSDTNTTYALSGALSSHKFTSTLTAGGSGSGTSTSDFTLAAGTGITITDDTSNRKMTIACNVTNTDKRLEVSEATSGIFYYPILSTGTTVAETRSQDTTGFSYISTTGSGSTSGTATFTIGNNIAGSSGKCGYLDIYGIGQYKATLRLGSALTANRLINLPNKDGTIALTSDAVPKPSDEGSFGFVLKYITANSTVWDAPDLYEVGIMEDVDNPGTYILNNIVSDVRDAAMSGQKLVLRLSLYDTIGTDAITDDYIFTNCEVEQHYDDSTDNSYMAVRFQGRMNLEEATVTIYLDETESLYTDGEVHVERKIAAHAGDNGGEGIVVGGWKICWGTISLNTNSASGSGTYAAPYYADSASIALNYTGTPYVWCQVAGTWTGTRYAMPLDVSGSGFKIRLYASAKNSSSTTIRWMSIGSI